MMKVLLIEDNQAIRENTEEILAIANYEVLTAENGKIGVELALKNKPDLIICDIMMPELDGYGVLHILSKDPVTSSIPFIFLTAKTEKTDIRKGMLLGADDYVTKPFDSTELLNAIDVRMKKRMLLQKQYSMDEKGLEQFIEDAQVVLNLQDLCKDKRSKGYKAKETIIMEGDFPNYVYYVRSGSIKTFRINEDGKEFTTNLYQTGDFFGYEAILENKNYSESASTLENSELTLIPRTDLLALIYNQPDVAKNFISLLCRKVEEKENQLLKLAYDSVRQRTAEALLKVVKINELEFMRIQRDDLARLVGTATESVIRILSEFKEEGLISIEGGKIRIDERKKLDEIVRKNFVRR